MRDFFKRFGGIVYILLITLALGIWLLASDELPIILNTLGDLDARWMWGCVGCIGLYLFLRAAAIKYYLRSDGHRISWINATLVTGVGQFYSAITPSASGGQPLQVLAMIKMGMPASAATATVSVKFIGFQLAVMLSGGALWATHFEAVTQQLGPYRWLVTLGYFINAALMVLVALTIFKSRIVDGIVNFFIRLCVRLRLIKKEEKVRNNAFSALSEYRDALKRLIDHPRDAIVIIVLCFVQVLSYMSVIVCLYHGFKLSGAVDSNLLTLQVLLFIAAAFVPLPGAAGAQEGGFFLFFNGIFPGDTLLPAMLCWRFFTYYLLLILGFFGVVSNSVGVMIRENREKKGNE